jgi:2-polyprenyl-3-methyl-5-hydroxy-6-metoxy-1,4-benzoquinol methylase
MPTLQEQFGAIDIYLFDQFLRGNVSKGMTIFDAGCGAGRNIVYPLREGYEVFGVDPDPRAIAAVRRLASHLPANNFRVESVEAHSFPDLFTDVVIINTVLHFARDDDHFHAMLRGCWRTLKPGGLFFCRLASTIGAERLVRHLHDRLHAMADGSEWYLVDEAMLMQVTKGLGAELVDPIKTTVVQNLRSMTTWVLRKR